MRAHHPTAARAEKKTATLPLPFRLTAKPEGDFENLPFRISSKRLEIGETNTSTERI